MILNLIYLVYHLILTKKGGFEFTLNEKSDQPTKKIKFDELAKVMIL